jgi:hypothetical protein
MKLASLREAVDRSGYPLQTVVAAALQEREFRVEEEWAFEDAESQKRRAIDVFGDYSMGPFIESGAAKSTVLVAMLVECKQSKHPYLGFEAVAPPPLDNHPRIAGLGRWRIALHMDDSTSKSYWETPLARVLSTVDHQFIVDPPVVTTISRAQAKGDGFDISGDEPHNALLRPLIKAASIYADHWKGAPGQQALPAYVGRLVMPVAVVDAPLLLVRGSPGSSEIMGANWMRVISHRAMSVPRDPWVTKGFDVVDIVHRAFFEHFLDAYALPYARSYYERLGSIHDALISGRATVSGWSGGEPPDDIFGRLVARPGP